jgi:hypothetical protein
MGFGLWSSQFQEHSADLAAKILTGIQSHGAFLALPERKSPAFASSSGFWEFEGQGNRDCGQCSYRLHLRLVFRMYNQMEESQKEKKINF